MYMSFSHIAEYQQPQLEIRNFQFQPRPWFWPDGEVEQESGKIRECRDRSCWFHKKVQIGMKVNQARKLTQRQQGCAAGKALLAEWGTKSTILALEAEFKSECELPMPSFSILQNISFYAYPPKTQTQWFARQNIHSKKKYWLSFTFCTCCINFFNYILNRAVTRVRSLLRIPPGLLWWFSGHANSGERPWVKSRNRWRDYISHLAQKRLTIPLDVLERDAGERDIWNTLNSLLPQRSDPCISEIEWLDG